MKHPHGFSDCQTLNPEAAPGCISSRCHNTTRRERWAYNNHVSIHIYINYINRLNIPIIIINYLYNYEQRYKLEMEIARFMDLTFDVGRHFFLAQGKQTVRRVHLVSECFAHKWYHIQQKNMNLPDRPWYLLPSVNQPQQWETHHLHALPWIPLIHFPTNHGYPKDIYLAEL